MKRHFVIALVIALGVVLLIESLGGRRARKQVREDAVRAEILLRMYHAEKGGASRMRPELPEPTKQVVIDTGPRLPGERYITYWNRTNMAKGLQTCRDAVGLTDAQMQAIRLALYDYQENTDAVMRELRAEGEEVWAPLIGQVFDIKYARIDAILEPGQRFAWSSEPECLKLGIYASDEALRLDE